MCVFFSSSSTIAASLSSLNVIIICFITGISFISSPQTHFLIFRNRNSTFHGMWWFFLVTRDAQSIRSASIKCKFVLIVFVHFVWCSDGCLPFKTQSDLLIVIQTNGRKSPTIPSKLRVEQWSEKPNRPLAILRITYITIYTKDSEVAFFSRCCFFVLLFIFISMRIAAKLLNKFASIFFCTHLSQKCCRVVFVATKKWENETKTKKKERKKVICWKGEIQLNMMLWLARQFSWLNSCHNVCVPTADTDRDLRQTYSCECVCVLYIERCLRRRWYTSNQIFCVAIRFIAHFTFVSSLSVRFYRFCWICVLLCVNPHIVCVVYHIIQCVHTYIFLSWHGM